MTTPEQLTRQDLDRLVASNEYGQIERARAEGRLADLLEHARPLPDDATVTLDDVKRLYAVRDYAGIEKLRATGRLDNLLDPPTPATQKEHPMKTPDELRAEFADRLLWPDGQPQSDTQATEDDLAAMTPAQINAARKAGQLDQLLGKH